VATDQQPSTFSDLKTDLARRLREVSSSGSATETLIESMLNVSLHDIHINPGTTWPWAMRRSLLITRPPYTDGTVSIAASTRTTVTGTSTLWNTAVSGMGFNNASVGDKMTFAGSSDVHTISAVGGDTSITLLHRYIGDALTDESYTLFADEYALASDFARPLDLRMFSTDMSLPLIGPMEFRRMFPRNNVAGKPRFATLMDNIGYSGSTTPRTRLLLGPYPNDTYSIPYDYITSNLAVSSAGTEQAQMTAADDEPIIPLRYRHVIVLHAMYNYLRDRKNDARTQLVMSEYTNMIMRMKGDFNIGTDRPRIRPIGGGGSHIRQRFDYGDRFDQIRDR
jgi:hypothetical protein